MSKGTKNSKDFEFSGTAIMGGLIAFAPHFSFGAIAYVAIIIREGFGQLPRSIGIVCLYSCLLFLFCPILGAVVSISAKSWYALKSWLAITAVAIAINLTTGLLILTNLSDTNQDPKSNIQDQGLQALPTP